MTYLSETSSLQVMNKEIEKLNITNKKHKLVTFNEELLSKTNKHLLIQEYMNEVIESKIYNVENLEFMNIFMNLIPLDEPCIHAKYLWDCGVLTSKYDTYEIKRKLTGCKENIDYTFYPTSRKSTGRPENDYYLTPKLFKKFLLRAKNTDAYIDYFQFLEDCIYYYSQFQYLYEQRKSQQQLSIKDDKIDNLEKIIKDFKQEFNEELEKLTTGTRELIATAQEFNATAQEVNATAQEFNATAQEVNATAREVNATAQEVNQEIRQTNSILRKIVIDRVQYSKNKKKM